MTLIVVLMTPFIVPVTQVSSRRQFSEAGFYEVTLCRQVGDSRFWIDSICCGFPGNHRDPGKDFGVVDQLMHGLVVSPAFWLTLNPIFSL